MRKFESIPQEEHDNRKGKLNNQNKETYLSILQGKIRELIRNPDNNEYRIESVQKKIGMKPEIKEEFDRINEEINLFKKIKYPELLIDIQDIDKLNRVEILKKDAEYKKLINGINYFSSELESDEKAINEISILSKQISKLIDEKFPNLFT